MTERKRPGRKPSLFVEIDLPLPPIAEFGSLEMRRWIDAASWAVNAAHVVALPGVVSIKLPASVVYSSKCR